MFIESCPGRGLIILTPKFKYYSINRNHCNNPTGNSLDIHLFFKLCCCSGFNGVITNTPEKKSRKMKGMGNSTIKHSVCLSTNLKDIWNYFLTFLVLWIHCSKTPQRISRNWLNHRRSFTYLQKLRYLKVQLFQNTETPLLLPSHPTALSAGNRVFWSCVISYNQHKSQCLSSTWKHSFSNERMNLVFYLTLFHISSQP